MPPAAQPHCSTRSCRRPRARSRAPPPAAEGGASVPSTTRPRAASPRAHEALATRYDRSRQRVQRLRLWRTHVLMGAVRSPRAEGNAASWSPPLHPSQAPSAFRQRADRPRAPLPAARRLRRDRRDAGAAVRARRRGDAAVEPTAELREVWAQRFRDAMSSLRFLPNSPTLMNAGTGRGTLAACFVLPIEDTLESIMSTARATALVQKYGGGPLRLLPPARRGRTDRQHTRRRLRPRLVLHHYDDVSAWSRRAASATARTWASCASTTPTSAPSCTPRTTVSAPSASTSRSP